MWWDRCKAFLLIFGVYFCSEILKVEIGRFEFLLNWREMLLKKCRIWVGVDGNEGGLLFFVNSKFVIGHFLYFFGMQIYCFSNFVFEHLKDSFGHSSFPSTSASITFLYVSGCGPSSKQIFFPCFQIDNFFCSKIFPEIQPKCQIPRYLG